MKKDNAIHIITSCSLMYKQNLVNKNLLFIYGDLSKPEILETVFYPGQFLHLTGVNLNSGISPSQFYRMCIERKLSPHNFNFKNDGSTVMKLTVLNDIMNIETKAKMIGDYDNSKTLLRTEKLAGNVTASVGFIKNNNYHIPNTALKEDIRSIVDKQKRVLAVYKKEIKDPIYGNHSRLAKGLALADLSDIIIKLNHPKLK